MKLSKADALAVLRAFELADDTAVPRQIERLEALQPSPTSNLVQFRYQNQDYGILVDSDAEDDTHYIRDLVSVAVPGVEQELLDNPQTPIESYGYPYKGKDLYLLRLGTKTERLDVYLASNYSQISRSSWQKYIKQGRVEVDGQTVTSPKHLISSANKVTFDLPDAPDHSAESLPIIYLDDDVIVIDKPIGVLTHQKNQLDREFTVADMIARYAREPISGDRPGIVHRLDRETSGVIIGARTKQASEMLKQQFADRSADKTYIAIIEGQLPLPELKIDVPIIRSNSRSGIFKASGRGKDALTFAKAKQQSEHYSLVELSPKTGRTHQLRVHMAHLKTPIHGDKIYGATSAERLYLHSYNLTVDLPNGKRQTFTSAVPDNFNLDQLEAKK